jgi:hypothetical protein
VTIESFARVTVPGVRVEFQDPSHVLLSLDDGDAQAVAAIAQVVRAGLPLVGAAAPEPDLARRYLEKVGREEAT